MTAIAIPAEVEFKTKVMFSVPAVFPVGWVMAAVALTLVAAVEEVVRFSPDANINGRSIPNKKCKTPIWLGIFAIYIHIYEKKRKHRFYQTC